MKEVKLKFLLWLFLSMVIVHSGYAQDITVQGQVWDDALGEPMIGVNVSVKGTTNGVITDFDGNFTIKAKNNDVIVFSFIGYKDVTVVVKPGLNLSRVLMKEDTQQIEEVIVVGYGQQKKASSVGAISSAKGSDLLQVGSVNSVSEALQGQIPGVVAINTSSKPGADAADLFIRGKATWGSASPLVLVDGIERDFNDVDVNEIESISVLKDASATAVYGVKGANGVILLTTKRGKNDKPVVNFTANFGFKQPTSELTFADYSTSMRMYNEAVINDKAWDKLIPESTLAAWDYAYKTGNYGPYNDYFPEVDWWNEMVKDFGFQQNYNLNISGGTERMSYFASLGYLNDGDIYNIQKNNEFDPRFYYKRYNWRTNFDFNISKSTKLSVNIAGNMGYRNQPGYRDADEGDSYIFDPFLTNQTNMFPIQYSDGSYGCDDMGGGNIYTEMNLQGQRQYKSFQGFYDVILNQKLDMITKGLSIKGSLSYTSSSKRETNVFRGRYYGANDSEAAKRATVRYYRTYDYASPIINEDGSISYPILLNERFPDDEIEEDLPAGVKNDNFENYSRKLYYEIALNYARRFGDHDVTALALFNRKITETRENFPSYEEDWVGRVTYNWKERYLAEVNAAYTGSEKFAPGKRFGFFPSFSIGWRVTEEDFMKDLKEKWLTNLKIRYSLGKVGSDLNSNAFNYIQIYNAITDVSNYVTFGKYQDVTYGPLYTEGALADADATWETAVKQNLGIEMTVINNLRFTLDLFNEYRTGILMTRQTLAPWMGIELPSLNLGETKNHGLEFDVSWNDMIGKGFNYFIKFNFSTSENRIVFKDDPYKLDEYLKAAGKPIGYQNKYLVVGNLGSIDDIFNYTTSGINNGMQNTLVPGDLVYMDYNADGVIDSKDQVPMEHVNYPLTTYSLTLGFNYKGFGFNAQFYAAADVYKEQITNLLWDFPGMIVKAQPNTLDRWTIEDIYATDVVRPSVHLTNNYNSVQSTYTYTDHSYIRLKNVELNYALPKKMIKKVGLTKCQIYVNGNNLFTISGIDNRRDPETSSESVYPIVRRFNVGARMSF